MGIIEYFQRRRAAAKLAKGRCAWCGKTLPDDFPRGCCSDYCTEEDTASRAF